MNRRAPALGMVAFVVLMLVGVFGLARGMGGPDPADATARSTAPTVMLSQMPAATAELYRYVADHADHFVALPCFCGCDRSLNHRSLHDCVVNGDGDWDAHAFGCAVCTDEAIAAREQLDANAPIESVRTLIINRFGPHAVL